MADQEERGLEIAQDQLLEWGDTPLKAEDRAAQAEEAEGVTEEEEELQEDTDGTEEEQQEEEVEFEEPAPIIVSDDPGEYQPKDYSFKFTVGEEEYTVANLTDAKKIGKKHAEDLDAEKLFDLMAEATDIDFRQRRDKEEFDRKKEEFDAQKAKSDEQQEYGNSIARGINYLVAKGKLPAPSADAQKRWDTDANAWRDKEFIKEPGIKAQIELINYIREENDARLAAGLPPFASALDAYNAFQLERKVDEDEDEEKKRAAARKAAGARVSRSTPKPASIAPKGVAVGRVLGSISDLDGF